jgi:hypothetical protein
MEKRALKASGVLPELAPLPCLCVDSAEMGKREGKISAANAIAVVVTPVTRWLLSRIGYPRERLARYP